MFAAKRLTRCLLSSLLIGMGCTPARPIEGVWRPGPGEDPDRIPGPMKNFGPFDSYADALKAACPLILSKPNATVGHLQDLNPELAKRVATEYCAWLYYTREHKYEMSMLTDLPQPDDFMTNRKSCILPSFVHDPRYERGEIKYIFAVHNHPFGSILSPQDLHFIEEKASTHPWELETKSGTIRLSTIAFFSKSKNPALPTCDGFYQYVPATREIMTWTQIQGQWGRTERGVVRWLDDGTYRIEKR
ncbi:hypothetical protein ATI61_107544 [Archangium gephyra]|uniref:Lipoprotein n=2 Tax=Archangium gephyra TaxID=48 RepID=A0ABX9JZG8_9BACT|nr:hypothetical protein [Archangium gephyra]REG29847.1 hypothetical protein ATI61_107544 [Archangium gephyra]